MVSTLFNLWEIALTEIVSGNLISYVSFLKLSHLLKNS